MNVGTLIFIVMAGLGIACSIHFERRRRAALKSYWARRCAGRAWRDAFPGTPKDAIREFLYFVVDAFGFERTQALKLAPQDSVLALYRACYPVESMPDGLELESLHRTLCSRYGKARFQSVPDGITFGELFQLARAVPSDRSLAPTRGR
jgi:propanediol dehydratase small subunit